MTNISDEVRAILQEDIGFDDSDWERLVVSNVMPRLVRLERAVQRLADGLDDPELLRGE